MGVVLVCGLWRGGVGCKRCGKEGEGANAHIKVPCCIGAKAVKGVGAAMGAAQVMQ